MIKFNQKAWLKPYINMNTKLRKKAKNNFDKDLFKLMNNAVSAKNLENVRKHRNVKLVTTEPSCHTTKLLTENLFSIEMRKAQILMNKPVYLGVSRLDLSRTVMYEFWFDYVKPKYCKKSKLCCMDTDNFTVHVKSDNIYRDIAGDVLTRLGTSNFELERPLPKGKNKKVIVLMKNKFGEQIMKQFVSLKTKMYSYLRDKNDENKKQKVHKMCHKRKLKFENY